MLAQQAAFGVAVEELGGPVGLSGPVDAAQGIERRAVPEGSTALLGQQSVVGEQFGAEQRLDRTLRAARPPSPTISGMQIHERRSVFPS